ncbi:MAG: DNA/RNA non-specific endonuclease [Bacteroidales bacterium]|nr:DNA/RNA non-specific endonuclease [Candidatus Sodaliphilus aphodohippi]
MKHLFIIATLAVLLPSCIADGTNYSTANDDTTSDTTAAKTSYTNEYKSTGDTSLLNVKLPQWITNQTLHYKAITVYFNNQYRIPNCVAYELTNTQVNMTDAPDAENRDNYQFERDKNAEGCPDWWEYKNSEYDRSHMAPAMDMRWNATAMSQCFLMTNICPQDHDLNDGEWRHMEEAIHHWAKSAERLVIFTGPVIERNMDKMGKKHNIAVPDEFFKVVYSPKHNRAIAFLFDNEMADKSWTNYAVTIDEVERVTGYDFLSALPDNVETDIESKENIKQWPKYFPRR